MNTSIRARLTLWYSVLAALALALFSAGVLWLHARWGRAQFDSDLLNLGTATAHTMREELGEGDDLRRAALETQTSIDVPDRSIAILDTEGTTLAAHWHGLDSRGLFDGHAVAGSPTIATVLRGSTAWRVFMRLETSTAGDYVILVAGSLDPLARQQMLLLRVLQVAGPIMVLATAAVSWWAASSALRPVTVMAQQAAAITAESTDWQLAAPSRSDELGLLAHAFNDLLARLSAASRLQRQFMADASHELRTPASVIQTATEVTLDRDTRQEWEYREALTIINEQSGRMNRMIEDMLLLARADVGGFEFTARRLYADEVVAECVRAASVMALAKDIRVISSVQPDVAIDANDALLRQLITNLLDNAIRYTPEGGAVEVDLREDGDYVRLAVSDTGPGIPAADRERVFERFVRLDPARSPTSGAGLGLPIARWIAEQHQGTVTIEARPSGGSTFVVCLPLGRSMVNDTMNRR